MTERSRTSHYNSLDPSLIAPIERQRRIGVLPVGGGRGNELRSIDLTPFLRAEGGQVPEYKVKAVHLDAVTLSGVSGTLKTSVASDLAQLLRIPMVSRGEELREKIRRERGAEVLGPLLEADRDDDSLDTRTMADVRQAQGNKQPTIIEGRLAGLFGKMGQGGNDNDSAARVFSILIISANPEKQHHRVYVRQSLKDPSITQREVADQTKRRQLDDIKAWQERYPDILGEQNPFDPELLTPQNNYVYDLPISIDDRPDSLGISSGITRKAVVNEILHELFSQGLVEDDSDKPRFRSH